MEGVHPAVREAHELLELEQARLRGLLHDPAHRLWRAVMLAPTLEVCRALLSGERVPLSALDPLWARRFGRRPT